MQHSCQQCKNTFQIDQRDLDFYKKIEVPIPKLCPDCRMQRLTSFRNERNLYKTKCALSGKSILSVYPPDTPYTVYDQSVWWSDKWDPLDYGLDFDFTKPFFDQFKTLLDKVPRINLQNRANENSEYVNDCDHLQNCYLCFNSEGAENSYYCTSYGFNARDNMDIFWSMGIELCYECTKVMGGYHSFWCFNCNEISDCYFSADLNSCKNCFCCTGLRQQEYCVYNEKVSREEYEKFIKKFKFTYSEIENAKQKLQELRLKTPHKNLQINQSEDCLGDYITNSKNCIDCFDTLDSQNCRYLWDGIVNNSYDCFNTGFGSEFIYYTLAVYHSNNIKFSDKCTESHDLTYCYYCFQCHDCFGCTGLRHKQYCILNKQYSKEDYQKLLPKIIEYLKETGEYGEFFPASFSPFGYNDTVAYYYFPLSREEALEKGFKWNDYKKPALDLPSIDSTELPENIESVDDNILNKAIKCEKDGSLFRIIPQELAFYRKEKIALPHLCPDCRHFARKNQVNPRKLYDSTCANCSKPIQTTYSPDRPETIYCEECYLKEVY